MLLKCHEENDDCSMLYIITGYLCYETRNFNSFCFIFILSSFNKYLLLDIFEIKHISNIS